MSRSDRPTRRQRLHYLWLVVENANHIISQWRDRGDAAVSINSATNRRARYGLPLHQISDSVKLRKTITVVNDHFGIDADDDCEPFGEPY